MEYFGSLTVVSFGPQHWSGQERMQTHHNCWRCCTMALGTWHAPSSTFHFAIWRRLGSTCLSCNIYCVKFAPPQSVPSRAAPIGAGPKSNAQTTMTPLASVLGLKRYLLKCCWFRTFLNGRHSSLNGFVNDRCCFIVILTIVRTVYLFIK